MPRVSRKSLKSNYIHVTIQGIEKKYIFEKDSFKKVYINLLKEKLKKYNIKLLAYCIMDNHAHMCIYTKKIKELSRYMQSVNTSFAIHYNKKNKRVGYVFGNRFKSEEINDIKHLHRAFVYIHLNPVAADICPFPELYEYSSYNEYITKKSDEIKENIELLKFDFYNYKETIKFIHSIKREVLKYKKEKDKISKEKMIEEYIKNHQIIDMVFQSEKIKRMIVELKKEKISFSEIARFLNVTNKRLKEIISE